MRPPNSGRRGIWALAIRAEPSRSAAVQAAKINGVLQRRQAGAGPTDLPLSATMERTGLLHGVQHVLHLQRLHAQVMPERTGVRPVR